MSGLDNLEIVRFTVTEDHLKLLRHAYVRWFDAEYGAPTIDPKRPYGNSHVPNDIAEILGWEIPKDGVPYNDEKAKEIHKGTETALEIALRVGYFKAGKYEAHKYLHDWREIVVDVRSCDE